MVITENWQLKLVDYSTIDMIQQQHRMRRDTLDTADKTNDKNGPSPTKISSDNNVEINIRSQFKKDIRDMKRKATGMNSNNVSS